MAVDVEFMGINLGGDQGLRVIGERSGTIFRNGSYFSHWPLRHGLRHEHEQYLENAYMDQHSARFSLVENIPCFHFGRGLAAPPLQTPIYLPFPEGSLC